MLFFFDECNIEMQNTGKFFKEKKKNRMKKHSELLLTYFNFFCFVFVFASPLSHFVYSKYRNFSFAILSSESVLLKLRQTLVLELRQKMSHARRLRTYLDIGGWKMNEGLYRVHPA